jgi:hypothetical protein
MRRWVIFDCSPEILGNIVFKEEWHVSITVNEFVLINYV